MIQYKFQGSKHENTKDLDITEIAKLVRKDLKQTFGKDFKFSVTIDRYSMGQSLNVEIKTSPRNYLNSIRVLDECSDASRFIEEGFEVLSLVDKIINNYNYDNSDVMTDYFDNKFSYHSYFSYELEESWRKQIKENLK